MKFQLGLLVLAAVVRADDEDDDTLISLVLEDIISFESDYASYIEGNTAVASDLLDIIDVLVSYSGDDYSTLFDDVHASALESFITEVPWYSRISSELAAEATAIESVISSLDASTNATSTSATSSTTSASSSNGAGNIQGSLPYLAVPIVALGALLL